MFQFRKFGAVVQRGDEGGEECCVVLAEFGFQKLDEVGDVPRDGHVAGHGKFRDGEQGFDLAEEGCVRLRFEQGDEVAEEGDARRWIQIGGLYSKAKLSVNHVPIMTIPGGSEVSLGVFGREIIERILNNLGFEWDVNNILVAQNRRTQLSVVFPAAVEIHTDDWKVQVHRSLDFPTNEFIEMTCALADKHNCLFRVGQTLAQPSPDGFFARPVSEGL